MIWDGDPLELSTGVEAVWIDGVQQSLENRQTRLRDRYRTPTGRRAPARLLAAAIGIGSLTAAHLSTTRAAMRR